MVELTIPNVIAAVRSNMAEIAGNASMMYGGNDNADLDNIIRRTLPLAINAVNSAVPAALLQGIALQPVNLTDLTVDGKVVTFTFDKECMRMVAVQAFDSPVIVNVEYADDSQESRMQMNPFIRGTYDRPVLVNLIGQPNGLPMARYRYYTLAVDNSDFNLQTWLQQPAATREPFPLSRMEYMPYCQYEAGDLYHAAVVSPAHDAYYDVSYHVRETIINQLTGMVLAIYGETDKAKYFFSLTGISNE